MSPRNCLGPAGEHDRAHDGDQDQHRRDFKRQQKIVEKKPGNIAWERPITRRSTPNALWTSGRRASRRRAPPPISHSGNAEQGRNAAALGVLLFAGIQQHDGNHKQNHDRAGVDDHLHGGHKFRAQQKILGSQRGHHHDQRQRAVDGMALHQQVDRPRHADRSEKEK